MFSRLYHAAVGPPTTPAKKDDALRFGLLGATNIAYVTARRHVT